MGSVYRVTKSDPGFPRGRLFSASPCLGTGQTPSSYDARHQDGVEPHGSSHARSNLVFERFRDRGPSEEPPYASDESSPCRPTFFDGAALRLPNGLGASLPVGQAERPPKPPRVKHVGRSGFLVRSLVSRPSPGVVDRGPAGSPCPNAAFGRRRKTVNGPFAPFSRVSTRPRPSPSPHRNQGCCVLGSLDGHLDDVSSTGNKSAGGGRGGAVARPTMNGPPRHGQLSFSSSVSLPRPLIPTGADDGPAVQSSARQMAAGLKEKCKARLGLVWSRPDGLSDRRTSRRDGTTPPARLSLGYVPRVPFVRRATGAEQRISGINFMLALKLFESDGGPVCA